MTPAKFVEGARLEAARCTLEQTALPVAAHPEFAARRTEKTIGGEAVTGWFTEDFTEAARADPRS